MTTPVYMPLNEKKLGFYVVLGLFSAMVLIGLLAAWYMESHGHYVTGMSNQVVWGLPHVFAIFLIVAASGALNTASIASVFRKSAYKPLARYSAVLAITLLIGGLAVLVLDLGRPDRLIVAMTHYNYTSIFAWNIILYTGLMAVAVIYLWTMLEARMGGYNHQAGMAAFIWRIVLTTGTGSIFGFIIARSAFDAAILAPMFVVMSLAFGTAVKLIGMLTLFPWNNRPLGEALVDRFRKLLGIFIATTLYFVAVYHLTNLYFRNHQEFEQFILFSGNLYSVLFWLGQVVVGGLIPLVLLFFTPFCRSRGSLLLASALVIFGGLAQLYVLIIGGQVFPMPLFPGMEIVSSGFYDGQIASYVPSLPEILLGISGFALACALTLVVLRVLPMLPQALADSRKSPGVQRS